MLLNRICISFAVNEFLKNTLLTTLMPMLNKNSQLKEIVLCTQNCFYLMLPDTIKHTKCIDIKVHSQRACIHPCVSDKYNTLTLESM